MRRIESTDYWQPGQPFGGVLTMTDKIKPASDLAPDPDDTEDDAPVADDANPEEEPANDDSEGDQPDKKESK